MFTRHALSAQCLDGSSASFYHRQGSESKVWMFFFEGGGWCLSEGDCIGRSVTVRGSSRTLVSTASGSQVSNIGWAIDNQTKMGQVFAKAHIVVLRYVGCWTNSHPQRLRTHRLLYEGYPSDARSHACYAV